MDSTDFMNSTILSDLTAMDSIGDADSNSTMALNSTMTQSSSNGSAAIDDGPSALVRHSMLYTLTITGSVTILMNIFVLAVIYRYPWMRTNANLIIASMAVTDFIAGVSTVTSGLVKWTDLFRPGRTFCVIYNVVDITVACASLQHVVGVNFERYLAIIKPLHYKKLFTKTKLYAYIIFAWVWSLLLSLIIVFNMIFLEKCLHDIPRRPLWNLIALIFIYPVPLITIIIIYIHIVIVIIRQLKFMKNHSAGDVQIKSKQLKMIKNVAAIFAAYLICWAPTMSVLVAVSVSLLLEHNLDFSNFVTMFYFVEVLSYANSLVNPVIYFLGSRSFQRAARKMLHLKDAKPRSKSTNDTKTTETKTRDTKTKDTETTDTETKDTETRDTKTTETRDTKTTDTKTKDTETTKDLASTSRGREGENPKTRSDLEENKRDKGREIDGMRNVVEVTNEGYEDDEIQAEEILSEEAGAEERNPSEITLRL